MPINVTGFKLRISATTKVFGVIEWRPGGQGGPLLRSIGRQLLTFEGFMSEPIVVFDDEDVEFSGAYRLSHPGGWLTRWRVQAIVETTGGNSSWDQVATLSQRRDGDRILLSGKARLGVATKAFRVRVTEGAFTTETRCSAEYPTRVRRSPSILSLIAMGGSSSLGSGSSGPSGGSIESGGSGSSSSSGSSGSSSGSSSGEGIEVHPDQCSVDPTLIDDLMEDANRQCNDLCAGCLNFIEHLGLRVLEEEDLASRLDTLRHKEETSQDDFCAPRFNPSGLSHRVVLGKWENSEHELLRPAAIKTFESILDEFQQDGGGTLLIVAQSLSGAKLAATLKDHWRWGDSIDVALFVAWDATHLGGAITSVGPRPRRVVNFFQKAFRLDWWQVGGPIAEADVEHDLTGCFSHNALARSVFVHQTTYEELRAVIAEIRTEARLA